MEEGEGKEGDKKWKRYLGEIEDGEVDLDPAEFQIEEEMIEEVMRCLEQEITRGPSFSSFVTINGNEESCGPSFSDSGSSVMASIDTGGIPGTAGLWPWFIRPEREEAAPAPAPVEG